MKSVRLLLILSLCAFSFVSCMEDDDEFESSAPQRCESNYDCRLGWVCDTTQKICVNDTDNSEEGGNSDESDSGDKGNSGENGGEDGGESGGDGGNSGQQTGDGDPITGNCEPGKTQTCGYEGPDGTEGIGPCKAAVRTCQDDGTWGKCEGGYEPVSEIGELCGNGIDDDCNGIIDDGTDFDGDGHGACTDCCETTKQCPDPKSAYDNSIPDHLCEYGEEMVYGCDTNINVSSNEPIDYAKAIGICKTTTEDSDEWGLIRATISAPNGSATVHAGSNGLLAKLGNVIKPKAGSLMLGLSSGTVSDPFVSNYSGATSGAPSDWLAANGGQFPSAASCSSSGRTGSVNDAVMLEMRIRVPKTAKSFSFNIYFLTIEYPSWICSKYNDFFIALLDSGYTSSDPTLQNPADKNLAMDEKGNPVGVNLAAGGLFTQCSSVYAYPATQESCVGTEELKGTGFDSNGGTGWLTTRGNVVGGEIITLRLAIWDLGDHALDSLVLIDNFKWDVVEYTPGTGQY
ncbi:choice-of-anchor L domain-containing protein [bacterium]|nr:choice-of-anchor L domain-containing protein [bacterium]